MKRTKKRMKTRKTLGRPNSAKDAARAGHKKVKTSFRKFSADVKKKLIVKRASTGARVNLLGTYRDGPSPDGGTIRCFYDPNTLNFDDCYEIN